MIDWLNCLQALWYGRRICGCSVSQQTLTFLWKWRVLPIEQDTLTLTSNSWCHHSYMYFQWSIHRSFTTNLPITLVFNLGLIRPGWIEKMSYLSSVMQYPNKPFSAKSVECNPVKVWSNSAKTKTCIIITALTNVKMNLEKKWSEDYFYWLHLVNALSWKLKISLSKNKWCLISVMSLNNMWAPKQKTVFCQMKCLHACILF